MLGRYAPAARVRNPLTLPSSKLELLDRAGRQLREEPFEALEGVESSQYTDEGKELGAAARLDTLEGALADARLLGQLSLGEARSDAMALDPLAKDLGDGSIGQLRCYTHESPFKANKDEKTL